MPILPLYTPPTCPDAGHQVRAPGGYEWWHFDAEDPATDTRLVALLFDGCLLRPEYLRRYSAYRRRPTRRAPPLPHEYPSAHFILHRQGKTVVRCMADYRADELAASTQSPDVRIGPNHMTRGGAEYRLHLEESRVGLVADFTFAPRLPYAPQERPIASKAMTGAEHRWVIAAPLCDVTGTIHLAPATGQPPPAIQFHGRGYHDHRYGTGPLGPEVRRWIWGRVLLEDRALMFHLVEPRDSRLSIEAHLIEVDAQGLRERSDQLWHMHGRCAAGRLWYPRELTCDELVLSEPRLIETSPLYLRLIYTVHLHDGHAATALCEITFPQRRGWSIFSA